MTDQRKLEKLFKQHYRQMYRMATILLHDDAESKDVVTTSSPDFLTIPVTFGKRQPSPICLLACETDA